VYNFQLRRVRDLPKSEVAKKKQIAVNDARDIVATSIVTSVSVVTRQRRVLIECLC